MTLVAPTPLTAAPGSHGPLGIGTYRAFVYDRGGLHRIGEIQPIASLHWQRVRDEISTATIVTAGFGPDCCDMMSDIRAMRHELVLFRSDVNDSWVRVWEGPITLVSYQFDHVEITAHDVMYYLFRRILREGFDDRYIYRKPADGGPINNIKYVVDRAFLVIQTALARDDPNVMDYLTKERRDDDAKEARLVKPFQMTVWELIDDWAQNQGLDYTVIGRRILLNDVHNPIGRLPQMGDGDFLTHPVVTEYGSALVTFSAVSDTDGNFQSVGGYDFYYGLVEMLQSSYTSHAPNLNVHELKQDVRTRIAAEQKYREARSAYLRYPGLTEAEATQLAEWETERYSPGVLPDRQKWLDAHIKPLRDRANKKAALKTEMDSAKTDFDNAVEAQADDVEKWHEYIKSLRAQALRNVVGRDPAPVTVRVPDGSQLDPALDLGINELVPGVWIPLRSTATCRTLTQWQKLNEVAVTFDPSAGEQVAITMGPAPDHGREPVDVTPTE